MSQIALFPEPPSLHQLNAAAALADYRIKPVVDYSSVTQVKGPLVLLENVKVRSFFFGNFGLCLSQLPKYAEIVTIRLGNGDVRTGSVLEISGSTAVVQASVCVSVQCSYNTARCLREPVILITLSLDASSKEMC